MLRFAMCGIAGLVNLDGSPVNPDQLDELTDALSHRGPDDRGTYIHRNLGLGFRRLAIIDLSRDANQPMQTEDGRYVLCFNGEIYNFKEKRALLEARGYAFRTQSDSEVLLGLYQAFGMNCLSHLRGMFAFAVFDREQNSLFLARDRTGQKPLKYFHRNGVFAFASELKALQTLSQCPDAIDTEAVHHFLTTMYLPAPHTGIQGIQKLPAAHYLTLDLNTGQTAMHRYWSLTREPDLKPSVSDWEASILQCLLESVELRMVSDVPLGAFLSGGVDSAAVVGLMSQASSSPVKTFSIGSDDPEYDELPQAEEVARHFGCDHHPTPLNADIVELLPDLVRTYDEPFADTSCVPTFLVSRQARQEVTVVLNGDGGDENFAGYVRYPILRFSQRWATIPEIGHVLADKGVDWFHRLARSTLSYRGRRFQRSIRSPWPERYLQYLSYFTEEEKRSLYRRGFGEGYPRTDQWFAGQTASSRARAVETLDQAVSMDLDTYLAEDLLPKVDLGSMAHGLEARSPFLDHELLELTARIPLRLKIVGMRRKWILKRALKGLVPNATLTRPKRGFRLPLNRWFRGPLIDFVRGRLLTVNSGLWNLFDRKAMEVFLDGYFHSRVDYSDHIWALLWLQEWMDSRPTS